MDGGASYSKKRKEGKLIMRSVKKKIGVLLIFCAALVMLSLACSNNVYAAEKWEKAYTKQVNKAKKKDSSTKSLTITMDKTKIPVLVIRNDSGNEKYKLTFYKYKNKKVKKIGTYKVPANRDTIKIKRTLGFEYAKGRDTYTSVFKLASGKIKTEEYKANYLGTIFASFYKNDKKISNDEYLKALDGGKKVKWK